MDVKAKQRLSCQNRPLNFNGLIENCRFRTGDDSVVKSGRDRDGREINRPSENVLVRHSL